MTPLLVTASQLGALDARLGGPSSNAAVASSGGPAPGWRLRLLLDNSVEAQIARSMRRAVAVGGEHSSGARSLLRSLLAAALQDWRRSA